MSKDVPPCCAEVVVSTAGGKDFFYCRGCKKEITWPTLEEMEGANSLEELWKRWQQRMKETQDQITNISYPVNPFIVVPPSTACGSLHYFMLGNDNVWRCKDCKELRFKP